MTELWLCYDARVYRFHQHTHSLSSTSAKKKRRKKISPSKRANKLEMQEIHGVVNKFGKAWQGSYLLSIMDFMDVEIHWCWWSELEFEMCPRVKFMWWHNKHLLKSKTLRHFTWTNTNMQMFTTNAE